MVEASETVKFSSFLGPILLLTNIFFLNFLSRIIFAPLLPRIQKDLTLSHVEAASLFLFITMGYSISLLGSGFISKRLRHRKTICLSATAVGISLTGIALCDGVWTIRGGLLMLGLAAGLYLPSGMASLTALVSARHWGKAIATHELAPNLSFFMAPLLAEFLMMWISWRGVLVFLGICSILTGFLFSRFWKGEDLPGEALNFLSLKTLLARKSFWIMMILFSLGICATIGIYTMLPPFSGGPSRTGKELGQYPCGAFSHIRHFHGVCGRLDNGSDRPGTYLERGVPVGRVDNDFTGCLHRIMAGAHGFFAARCGRLLFSTGFCSSFGHRSTQSSKCRRIPYNTRGLSGGGRRHSHGYRHDGGCGPFLPRGFHFRGADPFRRHSGPIP